MLQVDHITHSYDGKPLLNDISFTVSENEVLCLLGSSGSGKSTILRIIAGLEQPEKGNIYWNGKKITSTPVHLRNFGMVFQDYSLFPHMNVFENVSFGLKMMNLPADEIRKKVDAALESVGMTEFSKRRVTDLSGGEQQRIALARSLVVDPGLLMLDEPLGALDYSLRQSLLEEFKQILGKNGHSAIYVTHDQSEAFALADRIAILSNGTILQNDSPEEIYRHPVNEWCARFLGLNNIVPIKESSGKSFISNFGTMVSLPETIKNGKEKLLLRNGSISESPVKSGICLDAVVEHKIFRGSNYDYFVKIDEDQTITIRSSSKFQTGENIKIEFCAEDLWAL